MASQSSNERVLEDTDRHAKARNEKNAVWDLGFRVGR